MNLKEFLMQPVNPVLGRVMYFALGFAVCFALVSYQIL
jgi:hypothetical protein